MSDSNPQSHGVAETLVRLRSDVGNIYRRQEELIQRFTTYEARIEQRLDAGAKRFQDLQRADDQQQTILNQHEKVLTKLENMLERLAGERALEAKDRYERDNKILELQQNVLGPIGRSGEGLKARIERLEDMPGTLYRQMVIWAFGILGAVTSGFLLYLVTR